MNDTTVFPYLATAIFCEKVLKEEDGVISAIRIVNRINLATSGPEAPEAMPPIGINLMALVAFNKRGEKEEYILNIRPESAEAIDMAEISIPVNFKEIQINSSAVININFTAKKTGMCWFDLFLDGQLITKMPIVVSYQRMVAGQA